MRSIQDVALEILGNTPSKFYVFLGPEYGLKRNYIDKLKTYYDEFEEVDSMASVIKLMRTKRILPLSKKLYIVRYDEAFVSTLSQSTQSDIDDLNIIGTVVCVYEQSKHCTKLSKYLPNYCVSMNGIADKYQYKYIQQDYDIPDKVVNAVIKHSVNYSQTKNVCESISYMNDCKTLCDKSESYIASLFGCVETVDDRRFKINIAARNTKGLFRLLEEYDGDLNNLVYAVLSTAVELDKAFDNKYFDTPIREYVKLWKRPDIYYIFMHGYNILNKSRSISYNLYNGVMYLFTLLAFKDIPSLEDLK